MNNDLALSCKIIICIYNSASHLLKYVWKKGRKKEKEKGRGEGRGWGRGREHMSVIIFKVNKEKMILNSCLIKNGTAQEGDSLLS